MIKYECDKCGKEETASGNVYEVKIRGGLSFEICVDCKRELEAFMDTKPEQKVKCQRCNFVGQTMAVTGQYLTCQSPVYQNVCAPCASRLGYDPTTGQKQPTENLLGADVPPTAAGRQMCERCAKIPALNLEPHIFRVNATTYRFMCFNCMGQTGCVGGMEA